MKVILYLNSVYYRTIEAPDHGPVIHWAVPSASRNNRYRISSGFDSTDNFRIIEFRHCGLGNYHCHVSAEEEERIRVVKVYSKKSVKNIFQKISLSL